MSKLAFYTIYYHITKELDREVLLSTLKNTELFYPVYIFDCITLICTLTVVRIFIHNKCISTYLVSRCNFICVNFLKVFFKYVALKRRDCQFILLTGNNLNELLYYIRLYDIQTNIYNACMV